MNSSKLGAIALIVFWGSRSMGRFIQPKYTLKCVLSMKAFRVSRAAAARCGSSSRSSLYPNPYCLTTEPSITQCMMGQGARKILKTQFSSIVPINPQPEKRKVPSEAQSPYPNRPYSHHHQIKMSVPHGSIPLQVSRFRPSGQNKGKFSTKNQKKQVIKDSSWSHQAHHRRLFPSSPPPPPNNPSVRFLNSFPALPFPAKKSSILSAIGSSPLCAFGRPSLSNLGGRSTVASECAGDGDLGSL